MPELSYMELMREQRPKRDVTMGAQIEQEEEQLADVVEKLQKIGANQHDGLENS